MLKEFVEGFLTKKFLYAFLKGFLKGFMEGLLEGSLEMLKGCLKGIPGGFFAAFREAPQGRIPELPPSGKLPPRKKNGHFASLPTGFRWGPQGHPASAAQVAAGAAANCAPLAARSQNCGPARSTAAVGPLGVLLRPPAAAGAAVGSGASAPSAPPWAASGPAVLLLRPPADIQEEACEITQSLGPTAPE